MDHWSLFRALFRRRGSQKFLSLALAVAVLPAAPPLAAAAAPPSPGAVLQQTLPPPVAPAAPPVILALPAAPQQRSQSQMLVPVHQIIITGNHLLPTALLTSWSPPPKASASRSVPCRVMPARSPMRIMRMAIRWPTPISPLRPSMTA